MELILLDIRRQQELVNPALHMQELIANLRPHLALTDMVSPLLRHNFQQQIMADVIQKLSFTHRISDLIAKPSWSGLGPVLERLHAQHQSFAELLRPHFDFKADLPLQISALLDGTSAWKSAIDTTIARFNDIGLLGTRSDLVDRLLSPSRAFAHFMQAATTRLDESLKPAQLIAANSAIKIVEVQYGSITDVLAGLTLPDDMAEPFAERELTAPMAQFEASLLTELDEDEQAEPERRLILLPPTRCAEEARSMVTLVCRANEVSASAGKGEIFKPTTRFVEACADVGWIVADDKKRFGDVIDCLYFIFYEGAGKDNLRFLDTHGGPLKLDDLDFIWCLKHLRNKYARHDPDHGRPGNIAKSWAKLQQKWVALGLNAAPYRPDDFLAAQQSLIFMAREFIELIVSRLVGK